MRASAVLACLTLIALALGPAVARAEESSSSGCDPERLSALSPGCLESPVLRPVVLGEESPATPAYTGGFVRDNLFLVGLSLVGAGLVLGGAGFAVLYACQEGTACYNQTTQVIGWVLAAPGVIPLVVGLFMIYIAAGGSGRGGHGAVRVSALPPRREGWSFSGAILPGGAGMSARLAF